MGAFLFGQQNRIMATYHETCFSIFLKYLDLYLTRPCSLPKYTLLYLMDNLDLYLGILCPAPRITWLTT